MHKVFHRVAITDYSKRLLSRKRIKLLVIPFDTKIAKKTVVSQGKVPT